jgi:hypothetical protein
MLSVMDDIEARIREHAFLLWQEAGCPEDRAEEFWARAEQVERGTTQPAELDQALDPAKFAGF